MWIRLTSLPAPKPVKITMAMAMAIPTAMAATQLPSQPAAPPYFHFQSNPCFYQPVLLAIKAIIFTSLYHSYHHPHHHHHRFYLVGVVWGHCSRCWHSQPNSSFGSGWLIKPSSTLVLLGLIPALAYPIPMPAPEPYLKHSPMPEPFSMLEPAHMLRLKPRLGPRPVLGLEIELGLGLKLRLMPGIGLRLKHLLGLRLMPVAFEFLSVWLGQPLSQSRQDGQSGLVNLGRLWKCPHLLSKGYLKLVTTTQYGSAKLACFSAQLQQLLARRRLRQLFVFTVGLALVFCVVLPLGLRWCYRQSLPYAVHDKLYCK